MSRWLRRAGAGLLALALMLGGLGAGLWIWSGTAGSLTTAVRLATPWLPGLLASGQSLEIEDVEGVLREGGSIRLLRWKDGVQTIEAHDLTLAWDWRALTGGDLRLSQLQVRLLMVDAPSESGEPLQDLQLPVRMDLPFAIGTLDVRSPAQVQVTDVKGHFQYDGQTHVWDVSNAQIAAGRYTTQGRMQAAAPMALSAQASGTVAMQVPNLPKALDLQARASVQGTLSGLSASLDVSGDLQQTGSGPAAVTHAQLDAQIHPWQPQPVVRARARWSALDLAALWPGAPQTTLSGDLAVVPDGEGWKAQARIQNATPGPLNVQRLPLQSAQALVLYRNQQWVVQSLQAQGAGGSLQAQGIFGDGTDSRPAWTATATLDDINPALVDTRLAPLALTGTARAEQLPKGVGFALQLQTALQGQNAAPLAAAQAGSAATKATPQAASPSPSKALVRLKSVEARGLWAAPVLQIDALHMQAQEAMLQGSLRVNTRTLATDGKLNATAPGLAAVVEGSLASAEGEGKASLQVLDAAAATQWLSRLPVWAVADAQRLTNAGVQGAVDVSARWQGGWQQQGKALRLDAQASSQRLDLARADAAAAPIQLSALQADVSGSLQALQLKLRGQAAVGEQAFALQAQAHGGRLAEGRWDAWLDTAQFTARSKLREGDWNLRLARSVALQWRQTAALSALDIAPGALELAGPVTGAAQIAWQAANWSQKAAAPGQAPWDASWQTRGNVQGLPLAWLEILGQTRISNLGLRGDLVFGGQWEASGSKDLAVRAMLERTSGDLQLLTDDGRGGPTPATLRAGLRQARLELQIQQVTASAKFLWNSDNAGSAQADFSTRLLRTDGAWSWASDAPVAAQVRANLPRVGVWSLLAPPGWRIQGTLDADTRLAGTRADPQWSGTLQARDLSVRSVVDGIDFSQGQMRVRLAGQRLEIEDFSLQGAGGADGTGGGQLTATGSVVWLAEPQRVRMELNAVAQNLRVSARADQRLVVSGKLAARLDDSRLTVRGALVADQAQFVLPEDTAPSLGNDVVVRPSAAGTAKAGGTGARPKPSAAPTPAQRKPLALDIDVSLDPGNNFQISGSGLSTRLAGQIKLTVDPGTTAPTPRLRGELRTVGGSYKAYGQALDITQGVLRFAGPYDNPTLDILALRPNLEQQVGVQVSGTAQFPKVRLYSDPELPEGEKLSWLLLGRAPEAGGGGGADSALFQQAAMALLSGSRPRPGMDLLGAVGLDEVSLGQTNTTNADGSNGASATTVKLGKRLSRDFYVAYERSIASTLGTFYVFYDLSRRFTLRAESGAHNAIDLIFTTRFD